MNKSGNIILNSLTEAEKQVEQISNCPAGYIEVRLSTHGKLGAPKVIHVRNFKVSEMLGLSMSDQTELPLRLINVLNDCILEDTDVANWHEKEVEELMVYIFMTFYKGTLEEIPFPFTDEDMTKMKEIPELSEKVKDIEEGKYSPKVSIKIAEAVDTYDLPEDYDSKIKITNKKTGFYVVFDYIKYGDQIKIKKWLDSFFVKDEIKFSKLKTQIEYNQGISNQLKDHPEQLDNLIPITNEESEAYKEYMVRRTQAITDISHIVSIVNFNGEDVSNLSIGEKYEKLANDARLDYNLIIKLAQRQAKIKFGLQPEVSVTNPLTREVVKRPMSFQIPSIIQSMQLSGNDDYDDGFDDEN